MSDDNKDLQSSDDAEFPEAGEMAMELEPPQAEKAPSRGNGVAWLGVILALAAFAAVGYTIAMDWLASEDDEAKNLPNEIAALDRRLSATSDAMVAVESQLADSSQTDDADLERRLASVQQDVDEQLQSLNSLPARMRSMESSVAALAGISAGARDTFLLAEAEYYLQIANAQLQLANNPHLARLALGMADERVTQISDPGLTAVRRSISDELAELEILRKPDIEGATLTLASLARVVDSLPLASADSGANESIEDDSEHGSVDRAWSSVKGAMSGLVKVTPPDQAKLALLSPDAEYFLRNNLALQLQSARLALLRGEQVIFEHTLDDTSALLNDYFDVNSDQVTSAMLTISEIRNSVFTVAMPDISESLRLLRQFRTRGEAAE